MSALSVQGSLLSPAKKETRDDLIRRLDAVRQVIDINYNDSLDLKILSNHAAMSLHHMVRLFKLHFRITPYQYLVQRRMEVARILLFKERSVKITCVLVGYEDQASFSKLFKRHHGLCPKEYLDKNS